MQCSYILPLLFVTMPSIVVADDASATTSTNAVGTTWLWMSTAMFFVVMYFLIVLSSYPFVQYRTGVPLLFIVLIIVFPPSFLFLLTYLLILRLGYLSTVWFVLNEQEVRDREQRRQRRLSQEERRRGRV